jgi:hypothetical protein
MSDLPPIDEVLWREKFAEMGDRINEEREYRAKHPMPSVMSPMPPPPTFQQAQQVSVGQIAGTVAVHGVGVAQAAQGGGSAAGVGWAVGLLGILRL